jgi:H+/Cl- antiporter ClcA
MDYLKLIALTLSPAIALYAILVTYKTKTRTGDPNTEREVLTRGGRVALVLVLAAGLFSILSEWSAQRKKEKEKGTEIRQVMEQLDRLQKKQEILNGVSNQMLRRTDDSLLILRQLQGDPAYRRQVSAPNPSAAPDG